MGENVCKQNFNCGMFNSLQKCVSQFKAITKMVQEVMSYLDNTPNKETMLELIDTLRTVTEGKVDNQKFFVIIDI